jgi:tape measure domain-containing protein
MAEVTQLVLAVDSRQVRTATGDLNKFGQAGAATEKQAVSLGRAFKGMGSAVGVAVAALASSEIIRAADAYKNLNARLQLVSRTAAEFAKAQAEVLNIAQRSGVALQQTGDLYASLARSTQALGVSQDELLGVTESINQALIISGTSAESAQAALVQLGQGFASGALRGEELNSVLEQAPRLAQAIADGLGVPIGQLRDLGAAGELTAEKVFGALQGSSARLQAEFDSIPLTVERATTQAANSLSVLIGALDESTGATDSLAQAIGSVAGFVKELAQEIQRASKGAEDVGFLARAFTIISQTVRVLYSDVVFVFKGIGREIGAVAAQLAALGRGDFAGFRAISDAVKADAARARAELDRYQQQVLNPFLNSRGRGTSAGFQDPRLIGTTPAEETVGYRPKGGGGGGGGKKKGGRAPREQVNEADKYLESLRRQLEATVDLSVQDQLLRDIQLGRLGKVTPAQEQQLIALAKQIDGFKAIQAEEEAQAKRDAEALAERNRVLDEGRAVYEATRTPAERLAAETDRLNKLLQEGAIDWDTYSRAIFAAQDEFDQITKKANETGNDLDKFAERAAENIQKALGDELTNILEGDFDNIGKAFTSLINRMVAEALAADIAKALGLGGKSGGGGGFLGDLIKTGINFITGSRAIGGPVSAGGLYRVNERRPELLNVAGKQFLMMGAQGGSVEPNGSSGGGNTTNVFNFSVQGPVDRRTESQIAAAAYRGLQRGQRNT